MEQVFTKQVIYCVYDSECVLREDAVFIDDEGYCNEDCYLKMREEELGMAHQLEDFFLGYVDENGERL